MSNSETEFRALARRLVSFQRPWDPTPHYRTLQPSTKSKPSLGIADEWPKGIALLEEQRTESPIGRYGDFAFAPETCNREKYYKTMAFTSVKSSPKFYPRQTKCFLIHVPREIRDLIYSTIIHPFRHPNGNIILNIAGHPFQKWHPTRHLHSVFIDTWPPEYMTPILAESFEALRSMSNTHPLIRYELGEEFWRKVSLSVPYSFGQYRLPYFFGGRPAIRHLASLDLGTWNPRCYEKYDYESHKTGLMLRELAQVGVTFDYVRIGFSTIQGMKEGWRGRTLFPLVPIELDEAHIVDVLSTAPNTRSNDFPSNLRPSNQDWVNAFRDLSMNIRKKLMVTIHWNSQSQALVPRNFGFTDSKCPLLQWHLCPMKRPTFMSVMGKNLSFPKKQSTDLLYHSAHLGLNVSREMKRKADVFLGEPEKELTFDRSDRQPRLNGRDIHASQVLSALAQQSIFNQTKPPETQNSVQSPPLPSSIPTPEIPLSATLTDKPNPKSSPELSLFTSQISSIGIGMDTQMKFGMQFVVGEDGSGESDVWGVENYWWDGEKGSVLKRKWKVGFEKEKESGKGVAGSGSEGHVKSGLNSSWSRSRSGIRKRMNRPGREGRKRQRIL